MLMTEKSIGVSMVRIEPESALKCLKGIGYVFLKGERVAYRDPIILYKKQVALVHLSMVFVHPPPPLVYHA